MRFWNKKSKSGGRGSNNQRTKRPNMNKGEFSMTEGNRGQGVNPDLSHPSPLSFSFSQIRLPSASNFLFGDTNTPKTQSPMLGQLEERQEGRVSEGAQRNPNVTTNQLNPFPLGAVAKKQGSLEPQLVKK